jgi:hypothetical protein
MACRVTLTPGDGPEVDDESSPPDDAAAGPCEVPWTEQTWGGWTGQGTFQFGQFFEFQAPPKSLIALDGYSTGLDILINPNGFLGVSSSAKYELLVWALVQNQRALVLTVNPIPFSVVAPAPPLLYQVRGQAARGWVVEVGCVTAGYAPNAQNPPLLSAIAHGRESL